MTQHENSAGSASDAPVGRDHEDELLKAALSAGMTYVAAAAVAGVSERTVRRRMRDARFATEVSTRRGEHVAALTGQLLTAGTDAIVVLRDCMDAESEAVRLRAAQLVLTLGTQLRHAQELEDRLSLLEAAIADGETSQ